MKKKANYICLVTMVVLAYTSMAQTSTHGYSVINKIHLEGDGGWDYLTDDATAGRLYVSHSGQVQVVDTKTHKLIGSVPAKGVHGIAIAREFNKGFISNGGDATITVFNLQSMEVIANVAVTGQNPDAILYDPYSKKILTFNGRSSNATILDAKTDSVTGTIALAGKPEFAVSDGSGKIFVNIENKDLISVIYAKEMKVGQNWSIAPGSEASGLDIDVKAHRLFAGCSNKLMVVLNYDNGHVAATLPIGEHCDGVKFDPGIQRAYSSNGEGTLTVVQEENAEKFSVIANTVTQVGARTLAIDTISHHVYLSTADFGPAPEPTAENPRPRRTIQPGTFVVLEVAPEK